MPNYNMPDPENKSISLGGVLFILITFVSLAAFVFWIWIISFDVTSRDKVISYPQGITYAIKGDRLIVSKVTDDSINLEYDTFDRQNDYQIKLYKNRIEVKKGSRVIHTELFKEDPTPLQLAITRDYDTQRITR